MRGSAYGALVLLVFLLLLPIALGGDGASSNSSDRERDPDPLNVTGIQGDNVTVPPPVAYGRMINREEWATHYDFVAELSYQRKTPWDGSTGIVWKDKVLTAKHTVAVLHNWIVKTATHVSGVSKVEIHPVYDVALLTLTKPMMNRQHIVLEGSPPILGSKLMLAGFGTTATSDSSPTRPFRPVVTEYLSVIRCKNTAASRGCITGVFSRQSSCDGDSGGPWLSWRPETHGRTASVAGINEGHIRNRRVACGDTSVISAYTPTALLKSWIEQVAPGHFTWTPR